MNYYQQLPCNSFCHCESFKYSSNAWVGSITNDHNLSPKSGLDACINYRISTNIHIENDYQVHYNCFNEPFAVSPNESLYWDMHGLIFETSIWLLAGSTRYLLWPYSKSHYPTMYAHTSILVTSHHALHTNPHQISTFMCPTVHSMLLSFSLHPQAWSHTIHLTQQDPVGLIPRDQPALPPGGCYPPVPKRLGPPTWAPALLHRIGFKGWWFEGGLKNASPKQGVFKHNFKT